MDNMKSDTKNVDPPWMHGSIWPVTVPPGTSPAFRARGWGIVWSGPVSGVGGGANRSKITPLWFCDYVSFLAWFAWWLRTSTQDYVFKGKRRNLSKSGWRGITIWKLKYVFEGVFQNFKRMWVWCVLEGFLFCNRNEEIFLQSCLIF